MVAARGDAGMSLDPDAIDTDMIDRFVEQLKTARIEYSQVVGGLTASMEDGLVVLRDANDTIFMLCAVEEYERLRGAG